MEKHWMQFIESKKVKFKEFSFLAHKDLMTIGNL